MADPAPPIDQASFLRGDQELSILTEIGRILSSTLELREAFGQIMQSISDKMDMHRGALVLLDESTGRLRTEAAVGLTRDEIGGGKSAWGEGTTGRVGAAGGRGVVAAAGREPVFLTRPGRPTPATTG